MVFNLLYFYTKKSNSEYSRLFLLFVFPFCALQMALGQVGGERFVSKTQVTYEYTFIRDSTDRERVDSLEMQLLINDSLSLFASSYYLKRNSEYFKTLERGNTSATSQFLVGLINVNVSSYYILKDQETVTTIDNIYGMGMRTNKDFVKIKENIRDFDWAVAPDTRMISDFECQKAEIFYGGRKWIAWFTTEIPISDGPYKFSGLPGLIIELYDDQSFFNFRLSKIEPLETTVPFNFRNDMTFRDLTSEAFFKERKQYQENIYEHTLSLEENQKFSPREKEKMKERARAIIQKNNNWIELYPGIKK